MFAQNEILENISFEQTLREVYTEKQSLLK